MTKHCNICEKPLIAKLYKVVDPITKEIFAIYKCSNCGLSHTIPQPTNLDRYYGKVYYGSRHSFTAKYCIKRRMSFLGAAIKLIGKGYTDKKLLDIGCGDGSFLLAAKKAGWKVIGTELAPKSARSVGLNVMETVEEVIKQQSGSDNSLFDCITMWHSLEHIKDIKTTLSQLSKLLKPDGKLIIAVPDNGSFQSKFFKSKWLHLDVPRHLYHFDGSSLSFCLKDAGFTIANQWHQEIEYDLIGWSQSSMNCFLPIPNAFLDILTGKSKSKSNILKILIFLIGSLITALCMPVVAMEKVLGCGGTLIIATQQSL